MNNPRFIFRLLYISLRGLLGLVHSQNRDFLDNLHCYLSFGMRAVAKLEMWALEVKFSTIQHVRLQMIFEGRKTNVFLRVRGSEK